MISEITIKIAFNDGSVQVSGGGSDTGTIADVSGDIAPPELAVETSGEVVPAPPVLTAGDGDMAMTFDPPPPEFGDPTTELALPAVPDDAAEVADTVPDDEPPEAKGARKRGKA